MQPEQLKKPLEEQLGSSRPKRTLRSKKNAEENTHMVPQVIPVSNQQSIIFSIARQLDVVHMIAQIPLVLWVQKFTQQVTFDGNSFRINNQDSNEYMVVDMKVQTHQQLVQIWGKMSWVTARLQNKLIKKSTKSITNQFTQIFKHKVRQTNSDIFIDLYYQIVNCQQVSYNGLINQGNTCYMNSYLQMLYHLPRLKHLVFSIKEITNNKFPGTLQSLFYKLEKDTKPVSTEQLSKSYGWSRREVGVQQDVQEFSCLFFQVLERKINQETNIKGGLNQLFQGSLCHYIQCVDIDCRSESKERFFDLQLNISGRKNLEESLIDYTTPELLEGDNLYKTDSQGYQKAKKGVIIQQLPPVLMIQLKRFQFNPTTQRNQKVLDRYEYPQKFDFGKFCKKQKISAEYKLYAVLVHQGKRSSSGHYYAYLRLKNNKWYRFNDEVVTTATQDEVFEYNFGGEYSIRLLDHKELVIEDKNAEIQSTAYMLVYYDINKEFEIFNYQQNYPHWLLEEAQNKMEEEKQKKKKNDQIELRIATWSQLQGLQVVSCGLFDQLNVQATGESQEQYFSKFAIDQIPKQQKFQEYLQSIINLHNLDQSEVTFWIIDLSKQKQVLISAQSKRDLSIGEVFKDISSACLLIMTKSKKQIIKWSDKTKDYQLNYQNTQRTSKGKINGNGDYKITSSSSKRIKQDENYLVIIKQFRVESNNEKYFRFIEYFLSSKSASNEHLLTKLKGIFEEKDYTCEYFLEEKRFSYNKIQQEGMINPINKNCLIKVIVQKRHVNACKQITLEKEFTQKKNKILVTLKSDDYSITTEEYISKDMTIQQLRRFIHEKIYKSVNGPEYIIIKAKSSKGKLFNQIFQGTVAAITKSEKVIKFGFSQIPYTERQNNGVVEIRFRYKSGLESAHPLTIKVEKKTTTQQLIETLVDNQEVRDFLEIEHKKRIKILLMDNLKERIIRIFKEDEIFYPIWLRSKGYLFLQSDVDDPENYLNIFVHHKTKTSQYTGTPLILSIGKQKTISQLRSIALSTFKHMTFKFQDKAHPFNDQKVKLTLYERQYSPSKGLELTEQNITVLSQQFKDVQELNMEVLHWWLFRTVQVMKIQV